MDKPKQLIVDSDLAESLAKVERQLNYLQFDLKCVENFQESLNEKHDGDGKHMKLCGFETDISAGLTAAEVESQIALFEFDLECVK